MEKLKKLKNIRQEFNEWENLRETDSNMCGRNRFLRERPGGNSKTKVGGSLTINR